MALSDSRRRRQREADETVAYVLHTARWRSWGRGEW